MLLFMKYVSDKYAGQSYAAITVPKGASFGDMAASRARPTSATRSTRVSKRLAGLSVARRAASDDRLRGPGHCGTAPVGVPSGAFLQILADHRGPGDRVNPALAVWPRSGIFWGS